MPLILYRLLWCFKPVYPVNMMRLVLFAVCIALSVAIPSTSYDKKIGYGHGYVNNNDTDVIVWENYHNKYSNCSSPIFFFLLLIFDFHCYVYLKTNIITFILKKNKCEIISSEKKNQCKLLINKNSRKWKPL